MRSWIVNLASAPQRLYMIFWFMLTINYFQREQNKLLLKNCNANYESRRRSLPVEF